ncbi:MAG: Holliday junction resolvase RuvX [Alphaproteobacteria bacterium]
METARKVLLEDLDLGAGARLMGLDMGRRRVGVSVSDSGLGVAVSAGVLERGRISDLARDLELLAARHGVVAYVVGLPLVMSGDAGAAVRAVRGTMRGLAMRGLTRPWVEWDERLSSVAVARSVEGVGTRPLRSEKRGLDAEAAVWILQGALDRLRFLSTEGAEDSKT